MKNSFGSAVTVTLFGESHGKAVGAVIDGLSPGIRVEEEYIKLRLSLRRPYGAISSARREQDVFSILSGVYNGRTTGTPLCIVIPNENVKSGDYAAFDGIARPGHADYTGFLKYHGYEDRRGGGHFSGRLTAALTAAGAIALSALKEKGILVGTHILRLGKEGERPFRDPESEIPALENKPFATLEKESEERMIAEIEDAARQGDSVGGILESAVTGLPGGVGEPFFDTLEGLLSHALFAVPGVKGVQFGSAFEKCCGRGSAYNDPFEMKDGAVVTRTNHNAGVNGGISNGMPILIQTAVKPTPSIFKEQETVNYLKGENTLLRLEGRHDPSIVHRARAVADSAIALCLADALTARFGSDWFTPSEGARFGGDRSTPGDGAPKGD